MVTKKAPKPKAVEKKQETEKSQPESFTWKTGTVFERICFIESVVALIAAIVFLVFEFVLASESWPFIWFDITIGLAFLGESLTHWRLKRSLAIITGVAAVIFLVLGILKFFGVLSV